MTSRLQVSVAAIEGQESVAGNGSSANIWGNPVLAEVSPPVRLDHTYVVVAAFSFDPSGHPLKVLAYIKDRWSPVATLAAPLGQGMLVHPDAINLISEQTPATEVSFGTHGHSGFLIALAGGGCSEGAVVTPGSSLTKWHYLSFTGGQFPTSQIVGGNPRVVGHTVVTDNSCTATPPPANQQYTYTWIYQAAPGVLTGVRHVGWPASP
jgi:hypothetical protein